MTEPTETAKRVATYANLPGKPIIASWMGGEIVSKGARLLEEAGIPTFLYPDTGSELFGKIWGRDLHLRTLYKTPLVNYEEDPELVTKGIDPRGYLDVLFDAVLFKDVVKRHKVRFSKQVDMLGTYLINNVSGQYGTKKLANVLNFKNRRLEDEPESAEDDKTYRNNG